MTETQTFFAVLLAVYAYECLAMVRRDAVGFRTSGTGTMRPRAVADFPGPRRRAIVAAWPLPPLGVFAAASPWPFSLAPEGVVAWTIAAPNPGRRPESTGVLARFDAVARFSSADRKVLADGRLLCEADTAREAAVLAAVLERVRAASAARRGARIEAEIERSLDDGEAGRRLEAFRGKTRAARVAANLLVIHVAFVAPIVASWRGLAWGWKGLLTVAVLLAAATVAAWVRAHRGVRGAKPAVSEVVALALTPLAAARGLDSLSRDLFAGIHPAAVARVACAPEDADRLAAFTLRDAFRPLPGEAPDAGSATIAAWHHERWRGALESAARRWGIPPERASGPPDPEGAGGVAYCPRCATVFTVEGGGCADCGGLPRLRF
ncbi:MAG TPA: hypothetical protein VF139_17920 [Candidatus Polarisedimenticolaceae bacterium]